MKMQDYTRVALIAGIYTAVTLAIAPFAFGNVQVRISEALTMLPLIYQPAIWGVSLGCFISNLVGAMQGLNPTGTIDSIVGTLATLIAAYGTWKYRNVRYKNIPWVSMLMPVVLNFIFIGAELGIIFRIGDSLLLSMLINGAFVAIGEVVSVLIGWVLVKALEKTSLFKNQ